ncbi:hypothetical protein VTH82DRAFT_5736 [Thermothelomyces myriococcoides]
MSTTATMAVASTGTLTTASSTTAQCCPKCGFGADLPPYEETQAALLNAQKQIEDLQAQVRLLNQKATAAVDRWADYEDELAKLRAQLQSRPQTPSSSVPPAQQQQQQQQQPGHQQTSTASQTSLPTPPSSAAGLPSPSPTRTSFLTTGAASRLSALWSRKSPPTQEPSSQLLQPQQQQQQQQQQQKQQQLQPHPPLEPPPTPHTPRGSLAAGPEPEQQQQQLLAALAREQALRAEAEGRLSQTSREVEELSASLFEQANEMVAAERRARARLEARVSELERRDADKRRRLDRLERAVGRIERLRDVLADVERLSKEES